MPVRFAFRMAKHGAVWGYRLLAIALWICLLAFAAIVLTMRYWILPNVDSYRPRIVQLLTHAAKQRIDIGLIEGEWDGFRPRLILRDLRLLDAEGHERLHLDEVDSTLAWLSLFTGELRFYSIELSNLKLEARRTAQGDLEVAGIVLGHSDEPGGSGLGDWLLRQHRISLHDAQLVWSDETLSGVPLELQDVDIRVEQFFTTHRFGLRATPPAAVSSPVDIRGEMHGDSLTELAGWYGQLYAVVGHANFAMLKQWVQLPAQVSEGAGGLQIWGDLEHGRFHAITADVALSQVRVKLQADLPELQLTALRGRLGWRDSANKLDLWARALMFVTPDGVRLPPADIGYSRLTAARGGQDSSELTFDAVDLEAMTRLIDRLPVPVELRTRLAELNPRGTLQGFHVVWHDQFDLSKAYSVRGGFKNVGWHSSGYLPGVSNVTASFSATERGGTLTGNVTSTQLDMPFVFMAPLPIQSAELKLKWVMVARLPRITVERVALSNAHLSGVVTGTYSAADDAPGMVDLKGTFVRAAGAETWRYVPLVVPPDVRDWLQQGIVAAAAHDVQFILRGDLRKFPFSVPNTGLFQVQAVIEEGVVQFASGWPRMQGVRGRLTVRGNRLELASSEARIFGTTLHNVTVLIPDLSDSKPVLQARGDADGPTGEFLRFVRESPVRERVGPFIEGIQATGRGRLTLSLDLPLQHASDVRLSGVYTFADTTLTFAEGLPSVEQATGRLSFTQDEVSLRESQAKVFGRPARLSVATEAGGLVRILGAGQIDAAALRKQFNQPMLAQVEGITDWKLTALIADRRSEFTIESSLAGLSSSLPVPLYKPAAQRMPLRIERRDAGRGQDMYTFNLASALAGQLIVDRSPKAHITRGEIALSERAPAPQRDGVWISGQLDRLDFDQWQDLLSEKSGRGADDAMPLAGLSISARRVRMFSRDFAGVSIDAQRKSTAWIATLDSAQVSGDVQWISAGKGMIIGKFTHLELPAPTSEIEPAGTASRETKELPSMDITADEFQMGARSLGSLALKASPSGQDWRIERLELVSPDGSLSVKGLWQAWTMNPRTQIDFNLDVADLGRFLARLQLPKGIEGGKGKLDGSISWSGPPYAMDVPTLTGRLNLSASKGRFVKVDPGVGKLLAVLSLQTLPKVVTLDFRDIFSEGFSFDQIRGNADIVHGVARTQNFTMAGPAARVEMTGEVNLAAETQQLDVKIYPSLSDSVALGTALLNPVVGLGALVVQKALKDPLSHILSFQYHIAGTWTSPSVNRKKREAAPSTPAGRR